MIFILVMSVRTIGRRLIFSWLAAVVLRTMDGVEWKVVIVIKKVVIIMCSLC